VAWAVGAATAVAVGLLALSSVRADLFGPADPLAPAAAPLDGASPAGTSSASAPATSSASPVVGEERTLASPGGTVVAHCVDDGAYLVLWSPAPGFHADDVRRGPAPVARVKFERPGQEVEVTVRCVDRVPQSSIDEEWESERDR
jgi:hypothetical protein